MKSRFILTAILVCGVLHTQAQSFDFKKGGFTSSNYFIELPYQNVNDKIIVELEIKGKKRRFLLDTGAPLAISQELFNEFNLTVLSKQPILDINQKVDSLLIVSVDSLKLGEHFVTGPAIVLKSSLIMDCLKLDGFLGSNVLQNAVMQFDSRNQVIRITNDASKLEIESLLGADLLLDYQGSPFLQFKVGKKISEYVMFDSGSDVFYSMAHRKVKKWSKAKDFTILHKSMGSNQVGLYGIADSEETFLLRIPVIQLNGARISNIISETNNTSNSRVGSAILQYGILTLDYKMKKYYYKPYLDNTIYQSEEFQLSPTFINDKLCIGKIWLKELADDVSIGDEIISLNDFQVGKITICDALNGAIAKSTSPIKIEVKRNDGTTKILMIEKIK